MDPPTYSRIKLNLPLLVFLLATFTANAQLLEQELYVPPIEKITKVRLPETIEKVVLKQYPGYTIKAVEKFKSTTKNKKSFYVVCVEKGDEHYKMKVASDGEVLVKGWITIY